MTLHIHRLHSAILVALAAAPLTLAGMQSAHAQDAPADTSATTLDRIEVTGSRIPRAEIENEQPIITVTRDQIEKQGFSSVADILQNLTSSGSPAISRAMALSSGEDVGGYYIDLRNLGAQRTLILLNGKRLGVTTAGLQDLGQIPLSAIERIEVLKDGASSIYGSDAIAGVVNVITRRNFEGAEFNGYVGAFDQGEGKETYGFTMGGSTDRGNLTFSAEYSKEDPVFAKDREYSKYGSGGKNYPFLGWSGISLNGSWQGNIGPNGFVDNDGDGFSDDFVPPSCASGQCTLTKGMDPRDPASYHSLTNAEKANPNLEMMTQTGLERKSLFLSGSYDITDNIRFVSDIGFNRRSTDQQIAGYPGNYGFGLLSANSYFNPNPDGGDAYWLRRLWEVPRTTRSQLDTFRVSLGLEGTLNFGEDHQWNWDVGFLSNENTVTKFQHGDAYTPALQAALGPSYLNPTTGRVECGTLANMGTPLNPDYGSSFGDGQCLPFNPLLPFGEPGDGSLSSPDLQTFLFPEYHDTGRTKTIDYTANLAGTLFSLPAGEVGLAVGIEHRNEDGRFVPDAVNQTGQSTGLPAKTTAGRYSLDEAYAELEVPILADVPFAKELTFNVASRYSKYSNFGNTTNNKFQMRWRPMEGLLVRATYADGFRAPTISDLFGGIGGTFAFYTDPCGAGSKNNVNGSAACNAAGVPVGYIQQGQAGNPCETYPCQTPFQFLSGSNPDLSPETATSKTAGIVWSPKWVDGLDFTLDWYDVKIENVISSDAVDSILGDCYVSGIASRCAGVVRNGAGVITNMFFGLTNLGEQSTEGYDLGVNYRLPEFAIGKFSVNWQTSYVSKFDILADSNPETKQVGFVGTPGFFRIRSNLGLNWEKGDFSVAYMARYYSGMKEGCTFLPAGNPLNYPDFPCDDPDHLDVNGDPDPLRHTGANVFHDLQVSVKLPWNATASLGANNITDHMGPIMFTQPNSNFSYYGGFDIGRFWYMKYQQRF